jgi:poly-gamma-glutamate synthase PgsB/CapB
MNGMVLILTIVSIVTIALVIEMVRHRAVVRRIPIRIHVNGTRGKSSVTRLIAAGLRAGGLRTYAKTTGSAARLIFPDGTEEPIKRNSSPNIRAQLGIMRRAARDRAQALVIECMAVRPDLQRVTEERIVRSTIGVITNIRPDHLEVMGPRLEDVAIALSSTTPRRGQLFSSEARFAEFLQRVAERRGSSFHLTTPDSHPAPREMEDFLYVEIPENVGLALDVCAAAGVPRETALRGMYEAIPDIGATTRIRFEREGKSINFLNVFAANDRESIVFLWRLLGLSQPNGQQLGVLVNNRGDRMRRAKDMAEIIGREMLADWYIAAGEQAGVFVDMSVRAGVPRAKMVNMGGRGPAEVLDRMFALTESSSTVIGIGNIGGFGLPFMDLLEEESRRCQAPAGAR